MSASVFEADRIDDRLTLRRAGTRWLASGFDGGYRDADAAHSLTVPAGFDRTDLRAYAAERLGEPPAGPTLLTRVPQRHARGARLGPVAAVATAGLSNPAALPVERVRPETGGRGVDGAGSDDHERRPGTVNVFVGTTRALDDGALAELLTTAVEAKAATLLAAADAPGTTSDAVVVGSDPDGEPAPFAGSATEVGGAARACVREAVLAGLAARYGDDGPPSVEAAEYGVVTDERATVFEL